MDKRVVAHTYRNISATKRNEASIQGINMMNLDNALKVIYYMVLFYMKYPE